MRPSRLFAGLLALPVAALASTILPHTLAQRAEMSDRVAIVQVLSQYVEGGGTDGAPLKTFTRVAIGEDLKGAGPREVTIVQLGGTVGLHSQRVPGDANLALGESAVVFLRCKLAVDRCHLVALGAGKLELRGSQVLARDLFNGELKVLTVDQLKAELKGGAR